MDTVFGRRFLVSCGYFLRIPLYHRGCSEIRGETCGYSPYNGQARMSRGRWQGSVGRSCGQDYGGGAGGVRGVIFVKRIDILLAVLKIQHDVVTSVELVPF